jgi:ABC-type multidrug transport system permease subunit
MFWVYGMPVLVTMGLGIAFRNKDVRQVAVDIVASPHATALVAALPASAFIVHVDGAEECRRRLRTARTDVIVERSLGAQPAYSYAFDPTRPESLLARDKTDDALQRAAGRQDPRAVSDRAIDEPGSRYIDFLVPGLVGASLMGGGLWGVAFATVDLRMRNLLRRFLVTPMRKTDFLVAIMLSRLTFKLLEIATLLVFAYLAFHVGVEGSLLALSALILAGALTFSGLGLLVGCRARTLESVSGLMNAVMLPMWVLSGVFFSSDRFPAVIQPLIKALPLTALVNALRAVMLEGTALVTLWPQLLVMAIWTVITFILALWWFRWT